MGIKALLTVAASAGVAGVLAGGAAQAGVITVDLGETTQDLTLYGTGYTTLAPYGGFALAQGAGSYDSTTNTSTFTLSGSITGGSPGYSSGTYALVTQYSGEDTPEGGPNAPLGAAAVPYQNEFYYTYFDPSTTITLYVYSPSGDKTIPVVVDGGFVSNLEAFSFANVSSTCTGVAYCSQDNVAVTPGASISSTVTGIVGITTASAPEPATWAMMLVGFGGLGAAIRSNRRRRAAFA